MQGRNSHIARATRGSAKSKFRFRVFISKAFVNGASGKYKMSYDFLKKKKRDLIP